jgi:hypothetical protein
MNCLFCKQNSDNSKSVEHIIPESLGNKDYILPKGFVCDKCNQYFAIKIEKTLLEQPYFNHVRSRTGIENKKGWVPSVDVLMLSPNPVKVGLSFSTTEGLSITVPDGANPKEALKSGRLLVPVLNEPEKNNPIVSRFLAKVSVEALMHIALHSKEAIDEIMNKPELEQIKQYARYGKGVTIWPYHQRRIYPERAVFKDNSSESKIYELLHEYDFLSTSESHYYLVLCVMGIEYAINMGGPGIETYENWLSKNNNKSILDDPNRKII